MRAFLDRTDVPFLPEPIKDQIDPKLVGLYGVFNIEQGQDGSRNLIPIYWDYGKIQEGLLKLITEKNIQLYFPRHCGYQLDPVNPEELLKELREEEPKPLCVQL